MEVEAEVEVWRCGGGGGGGGVEVCGDEVWRCGGEEERRRGAPDGRLRCAALGLELGRPSVGLHGERVIAHQGKTRRSGHFAPETVPWRRRCLEHAVLFLSTQRRNAHEPSRLDATYCPSGPLLLDLPFAHDVFDAELPNELGLRAPLALVPAPVDTSAADDRVDLLIYELLAPLVPCTVHQSFVCYICLFSRLVLCGRPCQRYDIVRPGKLIEPRGSPRWEGVPARLTASGNRGSRSMSGCHPRRRSISR